MKMRNVLFLVAALSLAGGVASPMADPSAASKTQPTTVKTTQPPPPRPAEAGGVNCPPGKHVQVTTIPDTAGGKRIEIRCAD
jgi:hypothetical protein